MAHNYDHSDYRGGEENYEHYDAYDHNDYDGSSISRNRTHFDNYHYDNDYGTSSYMYGTYGAYYRNKGYYYQKFGFNQNTPTFFQGLKELAGYVGKHALS